MAVFNGNILTCCGQAQLGCTCSQFGFSPSERTGSDGPLHCPESSSHAGQRSDQLPLIQGSWGIRKEALIHHKRSMMVVITQQTALK